LRANRYLRSGSIAAILAVLLNALWPLIAQAKPANSLRVAVCSEVGTHYIELRSEVPLDERLATHHDHCKLCVLGCDRVALPLPAAPLALTVDSAPLRVAAAVAVPPAVRSAFPPRPRAPPFAS